MKKIRTLVLALPLIGLLGGCVVNVGKDGDYDAGWEKRESQNRAEITDLVLGTDEQTIRTRLGQPDFSESYQENGKHLRALFYRTQRQKEDGFTTKEECTALVFQDGKLIGWGDKAYGQIEQH